MTATLAFHLPTLGLPPDVRWMNALSSAFISLLVLGALAGALVWVSDRPYFALQGVSVQGDVDRTSVATIRANVASRLRGNFFAMDLQKAQAAFETVPWVRTASLRRVWPNRLEVELEEHRPAALWAQDGGGDVDKLVNTFGEVFEVNLGDVEDDALPIMVGPTGSSRSMLVMLQSLGNALAPLESPLHKLSLSSRGSWHVVLSNGVALQLGRGSDEEVIHRTTQFVATLPDVVQRYSRPLLAADLRHRDGYVVRLKGVSTSMAIDDKARNR